MAVKECIVCGTLMENVRSDKKYCSEKCRRSATYKNRNKSKSKICEHCGKLFEPRQFGQTRIYCFECMPEGNMTGNKKMKMIKTWSIEYKGGKCEKCGYDKCQAALDFHHKNPTEKDFCISNRNISLHWEEIKKELDKCSLLCANCHREEHSKED